MLHDFTLWQELLFIIRAERALNYANEALGYPCNITQAFISVRPLKRCFPNVTYQRIVI